MKYHKVVAAAATLALFSGSGALASDWQKVEDAKQLRALYENKTHRQRGYSGETWVTHYRADGKAMFVQGERRIPRTWEVKGNDQVCWKDDVQGQSCVRVERNMRNPNEILTQSAGGTVSLVGGMVRIEDGIPQF